MNWLSHLLLGLLLLVPPATARSGTRVLLIDGFTVDGKPTSLWLDILRRRLDPPEYDSAAQIIHVETVAERQWADTIRTHAVRWPAEVPALLGPFDPLPAPDSVLVVIGNRGGEDAFTHDSLTIGLDLSALLRVYGAADSGDNPGKIDRFFRHEVAHTLQKRWLARHPFVAHSPLDLALLDIWLEGLGNYYSLGPKWQPVDGKPSAASNEALARLTPLFVDRLEALACADSASAGPLLKGLSSGPFDHKWGAVSAALWIDQEMQRSPDALRSFVRVGPAGVWSLAERHLAPDQAARLEAARRHASNCR